MKKKPWWVPQMGSRELKNVQAVLRSNYLNEGDWTARFESRLARLLGVRHVVCSTSGTTAIFLALKGLGVGPGDDVIVPNITFIATANAVSMTGARPVFADVNADTLCLDRPSFIEALTPRTKAVIPVHVSGRGPHIAEVVAEARKRKIVVVEDAAEALLSKFRGKNLGTFGEAGAFSFSPNKLMTTGQGGFVATNDTGLFHRLVELKDQGRPKRGTGGDDLHPSLGFNFKLTNLQAAVGLGQLELLNARLKKMKQIYEWYENGLRGVHGIRVLPFDVKKGESPQWVDALSPRRDELVDFIEKNGFGCRRFWLPIHTQKPYAKSPSFSFHSDRLSHEAVWLPSSFLLEKKDIQKVCRLIAQFFSRDFQ